MSEEDAEAFGLPKSRKTRAAYMRLDDAKQNFDEIDAGLEGGTRRYTHGNAADDRAAWKVVTRLVPSLNEKQARKVILTYVDNAVLFSKQYDDPKDRKPRQGLYLNATRRPGAVH